MKLSAIKLKNPRLDRLERLERQVQEQKYEISFLRDVFKSFLDLCTGNLGGYGNCKNCQVLNDLPHDTTCIYYDEDNPRPISLCILFSLMMRFEYNHECDGELYDSVMLTLRNTHKELSRRNMVDIDEMISHYAPQLKSRMAAMSHVQDSHYIRLTEILGDFDGDVRS